MPSSRPNTIPIVVHLLRQLKPKSILDVGVGFGKWGHLFREYTDILESEHDPLRYHRKHWQVRIDGVEGHAAYLTPMHQFLYNDIHVGDATTVLPTLPAYDLVFLGDIIEHLDKPTGVKLLNHALERALKAVIVSTPKFDTDQEALCGNELERHRSLWKAADFRRFPGASVTTVDGATLLCVLPKAGTPSLDLKPSHVPKAREARLLLETRREIASLIDPEESFVLVDEEQLRPSLPHRRALPFLEKDGTFWGAPPDDSTAIRELERLREAGARSIVIVWSSFWWLEHYPEFHRHLRDHYSCLRENDRLVAFALHEKGGKTHG